MPNPSRPCSGATPSGPCGRTTRHPSGRCWQHRTAPGGGAAAVQAAADRRAGPPAGVHLDDLDGMDVDEFGYLDPPVGDPAGGAFLLADYTAVEDATVRIHRYAPVGSGEPITVLHLKLTPEGEDRLAEMATGVARRTVTVTETTVGEGPHPADVAADLHGRTDRAARWWNRRLRAGEPASSIRVTLAPQLAELWADYHDAEVTHGDLPGAQDYLEHQVWQLEQLSDRVDSVEPLTWSDGQLPVMDRWEGQWEALEERQIEVQGEPQPGVDPVPMTVVDGGRIRPEIGLDGVTRWDGTAMSHTGAAEHAWRLDLGDDVTALYTPQAAVDGPAGAWSLRRRMTVVMPPGRSGRDGLARLTRVGINTEPSTPATREVVWLERNLEAAEWLHHPVVQQARVEAAGYPAAAAAARVQDRAAEAPDGLTERRRWIEQQVRAAQVDAAPAVARRLAAAYAHVGGWDDHRQLRAEMTYLAAPEVVRGAVAWRRAPQEPGGPTAPPCTLVHRIGSRQAGGLAQIVRGTVGLLPQEHRRQAGLQREAGQSEATDVRTGGASAVFFEMHSPDQGPYLDGGAAIVWEDVDADELASRADVYGYSGDHFGATNPASPHHHPDKMARSTRRLQAIRMGELMVPGTVDLELHPPTRIVCPPGERAGVLKAFADRGIVTLGGRPVEEIVQ